MIQIRPMLYDDIKSYIPFKTDNTGIWLECTLNREVIAIFQLQAFTKITGNIHLHVLKEYQGQGIAKELFEPLITWITSNTRYTKLIATVPEHNIKMRAVIAKLPFTVAGIVSKGIILDGQLQNLLIFELNIGK